MLKEYITAALRKARYEILEDNTFYGEIKEFKGLYSNEPTLEDWILLSVSKNLPLPIVEKNPN